MLSLFAATPALVSCPSASSPAVVVAPALVSCPSASALACRCRCCQHLFLARQRLCLPLLLRRLLSLACQCPPSPAVVVAAAATNASGRARQIVDVHHRPRPLPDSVRPRLPLSSPLTPPTAANAPDRLLTSPTTLAVPPPPSLSLHLRRPALPQSLLPPSPLCRRRRRHRRHQISCFLGEVPFHIQRNQDTRK